jgi:hypothetical protein
MSAAGTIVLVHWRESPAAIRADIVLFPRAKSVVFARCFWGYFGGV